MCQEVLLPAVSITIAAQTIEEARGLVNLFFCSRRSCRNACLVSSVAALLLCRHSNCQSRQGPKHLSSNLGVSCTQQHLLHLNSLASLQRSVSPKACCRIRQHSTSCPGPLASWCTVHYEPCVLTSSSHIACMTGQSACGLLLTTECQVDRSSGKEETVRRASIRARGFSERHACSQRV